MVGDIIDSLEKEGKKASSQFSIQADEFRKEDPKVGSRVSFQILPSHKAFLDWEQKWIVSLNEASGKELAGKV